MRSGVAVQRVGTGASARPDWPSLHLVANGEAAKPNWFVAQCDRLFTATSLVATAPLLDIRAFDWTCMLRRRWLDIGEEARGVTANRQVCAEADPCTAAIVGAIPDMLSASFERVEPGVQGSRRPRAGRAVLTCQLGLDIPREGDLRMRVGGRMARWAEGETLVFDETQADAVWNDGSRAGVVLTVRVKRPLRQPGRWLADRLLR
jgi:beta-hydroxylase